VYVDQLWSVAMPATCLPPWHGGPSCGLGCHRLDLAQRGSPSLGAAVSLRGLEAMDHRTLVVEIIARQNMDEIRRGNLPIDPDLPAGTERGRLRSRREYGREVQCRPSSVPVTS
jgi:hypothetical protein